jgi:hypothetical protein
MLSNNEIVEDISKEYGILFVNFRIALAQNAKFTDRLVQLEEENAALKSRVVQETRAREELAEQLRKNLKKNARNSS